VKLKRRHFRLEYTKEFQILVRKNNMKKSELKELIKECHSEIIEEGIFDNLKKKVDNFLYNRHHKKNPKEWEAFIKNMESIIDTEIMKKYAWDRQDIKKLVGSIKYAVKQGDFAEAKSQADKLERIFDKLPNKKI
jgi:ribosomal protein S20